MYKRIYQNSSTETDENNRCRLPNECLDIVSLYKIKSDLKETNFSPYKIPFNLEILMEVEKMNRETAKAHQTYLLPDGKTLCNIDQNREDSISYLYELIRLYFDASQLKRYSRDYDNGCINQDENLNRYFMDSAIESCNKKGLVWKVLQTIMSYCKEECVDHSQIENILITGGCLNLKTHDQISLRSILTEAMEREVSNIFGNAHVTAAAHPQCGSILNGANILFATPQFDTELVITKKEYTENYNQLMTKLEKKLL